MINHSKLSNMIAVARDLLNANPTAVAIVLYGFRTHGGGDVHIAPFPIYGGGATSGFAFKWSVTLVVVSRGGAIYPFVHAPAPAFSEPTSGSFDDQGLNVAWICAPFVRQSYKLAAGAAMLLTLGYQANHQPQPTVLSEYPIVPVRVNSDNRFPADHFQNHQRSVVLVFPDGIVRNVPIPLDPQEVRDAVPATNGGPTRNRRRYSQRHSPIAVAHDIIHELAMVPQYQADCTTTTTSTCTSTCTSTSTSTCTSITSPIGVSPPYPSESPTSDSASSPTSLSPQFEDAQDGGGLGFPGDAMDDDLAHLFDLEHDDSISQSEFDQVLAALWGEKEDFC